MWAGPGGAEEGAEEQRKEGAWVGPVGQTFWPLASAAPNQILQILVSAWYLQVQKDRPLFWGKPGGYGILPSGPSNLPSDSWPG